MTPMYRSAKSSQKERATLGHCVTLGGLLRDKRKVGQSSVFCSGFSEEDGRREAEGLSQGVLRKSIKGRHVHVSGGS